MEDETLQNKTPEVVTSAFEIVLSYLSAYGWTLLFWIVLMVILWSHLEQKWKKWRDRAREEQQASEYHKNPDLLLSREEAKARAWQRLQEKHDLLAQEHAEKVKEQEQKKRNEKISEWERVNYGRSSAQNPDTQSQPRQSKKNDKNLRESYNPLMGSAGSSYRPSRRGCSSNGG